MSFQGIIKAAIQVVIERTSFSAFIKLQVIKPDYPHLGKAAQCWRPHGLNAIECDDDFA